MAKIDELETQLLLLQQKQINKDSEIKFIFDALNNKSIDIDAFSNESKSLFETMCTFCKVNNIDVKSILDTNIEKLKARYGEKFSSDRAINRNLEKERMILEKWED